MIWNGFVKWFNQSTTFIIMISACKQRSIGLCNRLRTDGAGEPLRKCNRPSAIKCNQTQCKNSLGIFRLIQQKTLKKKHDITFSCHHPNLVRTLLVRLTFYDDCVTTNYTHTHTLINRALMQDILKIYNVRGRSTCSSRFFWRFLTNTKARSWNAICYTCQTLFVCLIADRIVWLDSKFILGARCRPMISWREFLRASKVVKRRLVCFRIVHP